MSESSRDTARPRHQAIRKKTAGVVFLSTTLAVLITGGMALWDTYSLLQERNGLGIIALVSARHGKRVECQGFQRARRVSF